MNFSLPGILNGFHILFSPLSAVLHCDCFSAGTRQLCSVHYQSDSLTLLSWTWNLPNAVTFSQCCGVQPQPLGHRKWWLLVAYEGNRRDSVLLHKSLCFQPLFKNEGSLALWMKSSSYWCMACGYLNSIVWDFLKIRTSSST